MATTTMDHKHTGRKGVSRPDLAFRSPNEAAFDGRSATVVGRDLQALRDVLSLHLPVPQGLNEAAKPPVSETPDLPPIRQAAVRAGGDRALQLYICTPLDGPVAEVEAPAKAYADAALEDRPRPRFLDVRRIWRYLSRQRLLKRQRDHLMSMNDYMLRDIGIESRAEIHGLLRGRRHLG